MNTAPETFPKSLFDLNILNQEVNWLFRYDDGTGTETATLEFNALTHLKAVQLFALDSSKDKYRPPLSTKMHYRQPRLVLSMLGRTLVRLFKHHLPKVLEAFPHHEFDPTIQAVIDIAKEFEVEPLKKTGFTLTDAVYELETAQGSELQGLINLFNSFAQAVRQKVLDAGMRERVKSFRRNAHEREKKFRGGCEQALAQHNKTLAIRLDTASRRVDFPRQGLESIPTAVLIERAREIRRHRASFTKHLVKILGKDLAFFAWKIEYGVSRGFHVHWFFLLNGSKYQNGVQIAKQLGDWWQHQITAGAGTYRNINAQGDPERSGLRVLKYSDRDLWLHINRIADYLTKVDYYVAVLRPDNMRMFGCSKTKASNASKPGPKRRYDVSSGYGEGGLENHGVWSNETYQAPLMAIEEI